MNYANIPSQLLTWITGVRRVPVFIGRDFEWSGRSWTHNLFRLYELVFWRREGIRPELSAWRDAKGRQHYTCHSWESIFAIAETFIRDFIALRRISTLRIYVPLLYTPQGFPVLASPYLFAIAYDTATSGGSNNGTSPHTWSHVSTGSNLILFLGGYLDNSGTFSSTTYNGVSCAAIAQSIGQSSSWWVSLFYLIAPATGSHTASMAFGTTGHSSSFSTSYSGAKQSSQPDSSNTGMSTGATSFSVATTVVASNSWLVGIFIAGNDAESAGTGTTERVSGVGSDPRGADSNGTVGTGSQSLTYTAASTPWAGIVASIAPSGGTTHTATLTESFSVADSLIKTTTKLFTQAITASDTLIRTASRALAEAITNTAAAAKSIGRRLIESVTNTDTFTEGKIIAAGPNYPATVFDNGTGAPYFGDNMWINPNNVEASDGLYATSTTDHTASGATTALSITGFGFSVPPTATVQGVLVEIGRHGSGTSPQGIIDGHVQLIQSGTPSGSDKATASIWSTSLTTASYGGTGDVWGLTLTPSDINASNFGLLLQAEEAFSANETASVDFVRITVYYLLTGNLHSQTLADAISHADTLIKTGTKLLIEAITHTDTAVRTVSRALVEAISNADAIFKTAGRSLSDAITNSDTVSHLRTAAAVLIETFTVTGTFLFSIARVFTEAVTNSDNVAAARVLPYSFSEAVAHADTFVRATTKVLIEAISAADSLARTTARTITQAITNSDTFAGLRELVVTFSDVVTLADSVFRTTGRAILEAVANSDAVSASKVFVRTYTEAITNTASLIKSIGRAILEAVTATDAFSRVVMFSRTFTESLSHTDLLRMLRNGSTVIWHNLKLKAATAWDTTTKLATEWTQPTRNSTNWTNKNKSS